MALKLVDDIISSFESIPPYQERVLSIYQISSCVLYAFLDLCGYNDDNDELIQLKNLSFEIALWTYMPGQAMKHYYQLMPSLLSNILDEEYEISIPIDIINFIIKYIVYDSECKWESDQYGNSPKKLEYLENKSLFKCLFPDNQCHYVIVMSTMCIGFSQRVMVNFYIRKNKDYNSMEITAMCGGEDTILQHDDIDYITYESIGDIFPRDRHQTERRRVSRFERGDWITFEILLEEKMKDCVFNIYNNLEWVAERGEDAYKLFVNDVPEYVFKRHINEFIKLAVRCDDNRGIDFVVFVEQAFPCKCQHAVRAVNAFLKIV